MNNCEIVITVYSFKKSKCLFYQRGDAMSITPYEDHQLTGPEVKSALEMLGLFPFQRSFIDLFGKRIYS